MNLMAFLMAAVMTFGVAESQTVPGTTPTSRPVAAVPPPPDKVPQPDGTIQLVPVPPGFVYTPYYI